MPTQNKPRRFLWPLLVAGFGLATAAGATLYDHLQPPEAPPQKSVTAIGHDGPVSGIIDPKTGQVLAPNWNLPHGNSRGQTASLIALNKPLPDFSFSDLDGKQYKLSDLRGEIPVFLFLFAECPCSRAYNERMMKLEAKYRAQGVRLFYVFSQAKESETQVREFVGQQLYSWPCILDQDQKLLRLFDAKCATETFAVDKNGVLRYHGRIDDSIFSPAQVKENSLENALTAVVANKPVQHAERQAFACAIPRS